MFLFPEESKLELCEFILTGCEWTLKILESMEREIEGARMRGGGEIGFESVERERRGCGEMKLAMARGRLVLTYLDFDVSGL